MISLSLLYEFSTCFLFAHSKGSFSPCSEFFPSLPWNITAIQLAIQQVILLHPQRKWWCHHSSTRKMQTPQVRFRNHVEFAIQTKIVCIFSYQSPICPCLTSNDWKSLVKACLLGPLKPQNRSSVIIKLVKHQYLPLFLYQHAHYHLRSDPLMVFTLRADGFINNSHFTLHFLHCNSHTMGSNRQNINLPVLYGETRTMSNENIL